MSELLELAEKLEYHAAKHLEFAMTMSLGDDYARKVTWGANEMLQAAASMRQLRYREDRLARYSAALARCRTRFAEYVEAHLDKIDLEPMPWGLDEIDSGVSEYDRDRQRRFEASPKAARNQNMVDMIDRVVAGGAVDG